MQSSPQRDVQFFAKKGGLIFRYEKKEYIFVIWALKGMSPVNLKKKFENFLWLHYWVKIFWGSLSNDLTSPWSLATYLFSPVEQYPEIESQGLAPANFAMDFSLCSTE